jgi:hypothetical protein
MGAAREHQNDDHVATEEEVDGVVFSFMLRQRIREASQEAHGHVVERLRHARRQGSAAAPGSMAAEIQALVRAQRFAATQHGPAHNSAQGHVRSCYMAIAASAIILAERATRPERELPRGLKSSTDRYSAPDFSMPDEMAA